MKKFLASILATIITATSACSSLFASAIFTPVNEDTVDKLLEKGYTEIVDQSDPSSPLLKDNYYFCRLFRNGYDYKFVEYFGSNAGAIEITSGEEQFQEIYDAYKDELNFSNDEYENGVWRFSDIIRGNSTIPDDSTIQKKLHLLKKMLEEATAKGVTFDQLFYKRLNGCVSEVEHYGDICFENVTDEQAAEIGKCYRNAYIAEYPLTDKNYEFVNKSEQDSDTYEILGFAEFTEPTMAMLQEQFPDVTFTFRHRFEILESTSGLETPAVDLLTMANSAFGDVNLDGKIDLTDTILVKKFDAGAVMLAEEQKANADLDGNGTVDSNDAVQLLRFLLRMEEAIG